MRRWRRYSELDDLKPPERLRGPDKSLNHPSHEALKEVVHMYRHRGFCVDTVDNVLKGEGLDEAITHAAQDNFMGPYGNGPLAPKAALNKGRELMEKPHVLRGMEILFEESGFKATEAAKTHIDHIKGITYTGADGELVKLAPNYAALKDYWALTVQKAPSKIEVVSASVVEMIDRPSSPLMASRSLKKVEAHESD